MPDLKASEKNFNAKRIARTTLIVLLLSISGCVIWNAKHSTSNPTIYWGKAGTQPDKVWQSYDWELKAVCHPDCANVHKVDKASKK